MIIAFHVDSIVVDDGGWSVDHLRRSVEKKISFLIIISLRDLVRLKMISTVLANHFQTSQSARTKSAIHHCGLYNLKR